jgi:hypothetical protein
MQDSPFENDGLWFSKQCGGMSFSNSRLKKTTEGIKNLRQSGGLREIHDFASPSHGGFAISDGIEFGIKL